MPHYSEVAMKAISPVRPKLTDRQLECLTVIKTLKNLTGLPPSLGRLAAALGVKKATAQGFVRILRREGYVAKPRKGDYLSIRLVEDLEQHSDGLRRDSVAA